MNHWGSFLELTTCLGRLAIKLKYLSQSLCAKDWRGYCQAVMLQRPLNPHTDLHCSYTVKKITKQEMLPRDCSVYPGHCITKNPPIRRRAAND